MKIISNLPNPTAPTGPRPDGALKDVSAPGAGDGTPARSDWMNDVYYALLTLMDTVGVSADDSDEEFEAGVGSQFLDAMRLFVQEWAYPGLDFGLKNISGGNQASDITIYEAGGGSEKEDGFTVRLRWTGGDGTFAHTITAANTVGNEMSGFIAANLWQGEGAGELVLRLDKTNSKWLVLTPGIWDSDAGAFTHHFEKKVNKVMDIWSDIIVSATISSADPNRFGTTAGNSFLNNEIVTFPVDFGAGTPATEINVLAQPQNTGVQCLAASGATTNSGTQIVVYNDTSGATEQYFFTAKGPWA